MGANPTLSPLYEGNPPDVDIVLVELTPLHRIDVPKTAKNILNRISEIASINGLAAELHAIGLLNCRASGTSIRMHVLSLPKAPQTPFLEPSIKCTERAQSRFLVDPPRAQP